MTETSTRCSKCGADLSDLSNLGRANHVDNCQVEWVQRDDGSWGVRVPGLPQSKEEFLEELRRSEPDTRSKLKDLDIASNIVNLLMEQKPRLELFRDERNTGNVRIASSPPRIIPIRSSEFKTSLAGFAWENCGKVLGSQDLNAVENILEFYALRGPRHRLHTRLCWHEGNIWLDLANEAEQAISITPHGWSIISDPPILFRRFSHQQPIAIPASGGDPWRLMDYSNIPKEAQLLVMTHVATLLIPGFPHPVWNTFGSQGAAKSTTHRLVRRLIDPSVVDLLTLPRDERELIQMLDHHYLAFFDNVSKLPWWISDALCRATTGLGFSKRRLYTDDSDVIYQFQRCVGLNGINVVARASDLLDRSLLTELPAIPDEKKREETQLWKDFEKDSPSILGGFLDAIAKALAMPEPRLGTNYRMADFVSWGYRVSTALGRTGHDFLKAYSNNIAAIAEEAVHADPVGEILIRFLAVNEEWEGSMTELLNHLSDQAAAAKISTRQKAWPKSPDALGRLLRRLKEPIFRIGYAVEFDRTGRGRTLSVSKILSQVSQESHKTLVRNETGDTSDTSDTISGTYPKTGYDFSKDLCNNCWTRKRYAHLRGVAKTGPPSSTSCEDCGGPSELRAGIMT